MGYFGLENMLLRHYLSGAQAMRTRRGFDKPVVNDMGMGYRSSAQRRGTSMGMMSKYMRKTIKDLEKTKKIKDKKPKKDKEEKIKEDEVSVPTAAPPTEEPGGLDSPLTGGEELPPIV